MLIGAASVVSQPAELRRLVKDYSGSTCRPSVDRGSGKPTFALESGSQRKAGTAFVTAGETAACEFRCPSVALDCPRSRDCAAGNGATSGGAACRQRVNIPGRCNSCDSHLERHTHAMLGNGFGTVDRYS